MQTTPLINVPNNPANQGTNPMKQMFNINDLNYIYGLVDPGKTSDIDRILRGLGGATEFTLEDLQTKGKLKGLSSRSRKAWNEALAKLNSAMTAPASSTPATAPTVPTTGWSTMQGALTPLQSPQSPWDALAAYRAPTGPVQNFLTGILGQGPNALTPQPGPVQDWMTGILGQGPNAVTPQAGPVQDWMTALLGQGPQGVTPQAGSTENWLTNMVRQGPGAFTVGAGPAEQQLSALVGQGPGNLTLPQSLGELALALSLGNPMLTGLMNGEIPPGIMQQMEDQLELGRANTLEQFSMGGARFGSDVAEQLMRQEMMARTNLLAETEKQALNANQLFQGGAGALGGLEQGRYGPALSAWTGLAETLPQNELARLLSGQNLFGNLAGMLPGLESSRNMQGLSNYLGLGQNLTGLEGNQGLQGLANYLGLGQNLTGFEANQGGQGLNNFLGLGSNLLGTEANQGQQAMAYLFKEFLQNSGLPPELVTLIQLGALSSGAGTTTSTQPGQSIFQSTIAPLAGAAAGFFI
jgi:hypothetical protein